MVAKDRLGSASQELRNRYDTGAYLFGIVEKNGAWGRTWVIVKAESLEAARNRLTEKYQGWEIKKEAHLLDMFELPGGHW